MYKGKGSLGQQLGRVLKDRKTDAAGESVEQALARWSQSSADGGEDRRVAAPAQCVAPPDVPSPCHLCLKPDCCLAWSPHGKHECHPLAGCVAAGHATQLADHADEVADLTIGLDFGTASVKAVITDPALKLSMAVPFRSGEGIQSYLLPTTLHSAGPDIHDLKLALLRDPLLPSHQVHVVQFLAESIRHVRGWLFVHRRQEYVRSYIYWGMVLGLPIAKAGDDVLTATYLQLGHAAWLAAGSDDERVSEATACMALQQVQSHLQSGKSLEDLTDLELKVAPEVVAQIQGFMSSRACDPSGRNLYLLVDVGAGTLDASVFSIKRSPSGDRAIRFSATVEPHGVMCLHHQRMRWFEQLLASEAADHPELLAAVRSIEGIADAETPLPQRVADYFRGLDVQFDPSLTNPDEPFYRAVRKQVSEDTYVRPHLDRLLQKEQLKDMPMILCGGGKRQRLYAQLPDSMRSQEGYSWFGTRLFTLQPPEDLQAPGVQAVDYDRLSVAYGLSRMRETELVTDIPPFENAYRQLEWRDAYPEQ